MIGSSPLVKLLAVGSVCWLGACGSDQDPSGSAALPPYAEQEFSLGFGETVLAGGLSIEFTTLANDTRCPFEAMCLAGEPGNARILVTVQKGGEVGVLELNTHPDFPANGTFAGHVIELSDLAPDLPSVWEPAQNYVATLLMRRVAR